MSITNKDISKPVPTRNRTAFLVWVGIVTVSAISSLLWLSSELIGCYLEKTPFPSYAHILCAGFIHSVAFFLLYRNYRHTNIRRIHATALDNLRQLVSLCQTNDTAVARLIDKLRQFELISQGCTLAPPESSYSCRSREQPMLSRKTLDIRRTVRSILHVQFRQFISFIGKIQPLIHQNNLSRLCDMYSVETFPSQSLDVDKIIKPSQCTTTQLDQLTNATRLKRRECLMQMLALDIMTTGHDSERADYERNWEGVIKIMSDLIAQYRECTQQICDILSSETFDTGTSADPVTNEDGHYTNPQLQELLYRFSTLEKYVQSVQAKIFLCRYDMKALYRDRGNY
ncbi:hypothetical protein DFQ29_004991 [Apophysomyces sp. BC1021]|nr:hypothetical protein DFQ29_004991 [Apophysomyces sp. BC1021]